MTALTYDAAAFIGATVPRTTAVADRSRAAAVARMKARKTTCTPERLVSFQNSSKPEVSGNLRKRYIFF